MAECVCVHECVLDELKWCWKCSCTVTHGSNLSTFFYLFIQGVWSV